MEGTRATILAPVRSDDPRRDRKRRVGGPVRKGGVCQNRTASPHGECTSDGEREPESALKELKPNPLSKGLGKWDTEGERGAEVSPEGEDVLCSWEMDSQDQEKEEEKQKGSSNSQSTSNTDSPAPSSSCTGERDAHTPSHSHNWNLHCGQNHNFDSFVLVEDY